MLVIVVPTIIAALVFAWWFRASNHRARYRPGFVYSGQIEIIVWSIPILVILFLSGVIWIGSHDLDPYRPIPSPKPPLQVQVVSLNWKWLFIYPDQGVASVNDLVLPVGVPVHFSLTSATVMNNFFVPQLGSMIAAMNGMETQLHLQADHPGEYPGLSTQFSGDGFSGMHFTVRAVPEDEFTRWVESAKLPGPTLDRAGYAALNQESQNVKPFTYRAIDPALFHAIVTQEVPPGPGPRGGAGPWPSAPYRSTDMLGKLTWNAIPWDQPIPLIAGAVVFIFLLAVIAWIILKGHLPYLWNEWITSVDHKRIGVMYCSLALVMLLRGFIDAIMMRSQQAVAFHAPGYLPPEHYDQVFSAHGTIMIFFGAMPFMIGLINFVVPLQLGVRDVAFPTLNSVSFWLTATGALLVNLSLVIGEFARTGWLPYPPLSEATYLPGVGVDYYLWAFHISGVGTLMTGINFVTTILKVRAPGMSYLRMPMFCWTALASNLLSSRPFRF